MAKPKLSEQDFIKAAKTLNCEVAAIKAVAETESRGEGFYADGFPVILFERHKFHKLTRGEYDETHPTISNPKAGGYGKAGQNQRDKFNLAFSLDPRAAMESCSWGKFQIMGFNHELCGFKTVGAFVDAMKESEGAQLQAFVEFVKSCGLADELRNHQWARFAAHYNGAGYKANNYDAKMAKAYQKHSQIAARLASQTIEQAGEPDAETPVLKPTVADGRQETISGENSPNNLSGASDTTPAETNAPLTSPEQSTQQAVADSKPPTDEQQVICKERPSTFVRIGAMITGAIGSVTALGFNIADVVTNRINGLTNSQIFFGVLGLGFVALAVYLYDRSANRANRLNIEKMQIAADKNRITTELSANKGVNK